MNVLATSDVVTDMNVLGTSDVVTDMNVLGTSANVTAMNTLGTSANVTAMSTVAANVAGVNSFADRYRITSGDPGDSLNAGDLNYNTSSNSVKYYNGSSWVSITAPEVSLAGTETLTNKTLTSPKIAEIVSLGSGNITLDAEADINLEAAADVNIPVNIGLTFGDDGEKIEGDGTQLTISSSSHLTLDSGATIILDSNSGEVTFKDDGTTIGFFLNESSDFTIRSAVANKDLLFKGKDGGSVITALSLDMSNAGAATFNAAANVTQRAITSSSNAVAWDAIEKPNAYHLTTENTTFAVPSNAVEGAYISLEIEYDGSHSIGWNTIFEFAASTEPTETATDGKSDLHTFRYNGAIWQEVGRSMNLSAT